MGYDVNTYLAISIVYLCSLTNLTINDEGLFSMKL